MKKPRNGKMKSGKRSTTGPSNKKRKHKTERKSNPSSLSAKTTSDGKRSERSSSPSTNSKGTGLIRSPSSSLDEKPTSTASVHSIHLKTATMENVPNVSNPQPMRTKEDRKAPSRKCRSTKGKMRNAMLAFQTLMKVKASKFGERLKGRNKPKKLFDDHDVPMPGFSATLTPKAWDMETSTMKKAKKAHSTSSNLKRKSTEKKHSARISLTKSERDVLAGERKGAGTKRVLCKMTETDEPSERSVATQSSLRDTDEETDDEDDDKIPQETRKQPKK